MEEVDAKHVVDYVAHYGINSCVEMYPWCRTCLSTATMHSCTPVESVQERSRLRSASTGCVELPRVRLSVGQHSFTYCGPTVWNSLPSALRDGSPIIEHVRATSEVIFSNSHKHHPTPLWRLAILAPFINVIAYLLIYLRN